MVERITGTQPSSDIENRRGSCAGLNVYCAKGCLRSAVVEVVGLTDLDRGPIYSDDCFHNGFGIAERRHISAYLPKRYRIAHMDPRKVCRLCVNRNRWDRH